MPEQVLPLTGLDQIGLIKDTPAAALPHQGFSDARNVRFRDGAVQKMEGEVNIFPDLFDDETILKYVVWWPNPNLVAEHKGYYLLIAQQADEEGNQRDYTYLVEPDGEPRNVSPEGGFEPDDQGNWQHTFFQGGFCLIINNGEDVPHYILDPEGNTDIEEVPVFARLPGWESYEVNEVLLSDTFNSEAHSYVFDLGQLVDYDVYSIAIKVGDNDEIIRTGNGDEANINIETDTETQTTIVTFNETSLPDNTQVHLTLRSNNPVQVRCGVIRTFGDFLCAANLSERDANDFQVVVRNLPGVVRTSDVAQPGAIPNNWNPFAAGVSTADEFVVTQEGIVQDMLELQGSLYIYSNSSISIMRQTGNPAVPLQVTSVTDSYGVQTTNGAIQFDGAHFVVGSQDIYTFGGHPGNIQSVADGRVRDYFYSSLNPLHEQRMFLVRHRQKDEIWICYPSTSSITGECNEALIWNYRKNNWTVRDLYNVLAGDLGPVPGGGVPSRLIDLTGDSGDNGFINIGATEVQTIAIDPATRLTGDTDGHPTRYTITVNEETFPAFTTPIGQPIYDIVLQDDFWTGETDPIWFIAEGRDTNDDITFVIEEQFPPNLTTKQEVIDFLHTIENFDTYLDIEDVIDSENEFVIDVVDTDTVGGFITFGLRQVWDRDTLIRNTDIDVQDPETGVLYDTEISGVMWEKRVVSVYIDPAAVGKYYFLNLGDPGPDDFLWRYMPSVGHTTPMYGMDNIAGSYMYNDGDHEGRGGVVVRPVKPGDTSHFMYRERIQESDDFEINQPWIPTRAGMHDFTILVPSTFTWNGFTLDGYDAPVLYSDGNYQMTTTNADLTRHAFPNIDTADAYPVLVFNNGRYAYNESADRSGGDPDVKEAGERVYVALGGDLSESNANRFNDVADFIAEHFNDDATSLFHAFSTDNVVHLTSRRNGKHFIDRIDTGGNPHGVDIFRDIDTEEVDRGLWTLTQAPVNPNLDVYHQQIVYPEITWTLDGDQGMNYSIPTTVENPDSSTEVSATDIMTTTIREEFADELVDGWSSTVLPNDYVQFTNHAAMLGATDRDDGNVTSREVLNRWVATVTRYGNTFPERADWDPQFEYSKIDQTTSADTIYGIDIDSSNDFRGAFALRATPSYISFLVYNTAATNNLETITLQAGERGDYSIIEQTGTNGIRLTDEETAEKWIQELRLANRRLNVLDRGTQGQFLVQPANYDDTANFVLEVAYNFDQAGAERVAEFRSGMIRYPITSTELTEVSVNSRSAELYRNEIGVGIFQDFMPHSNSWSMEGNDTNTVVDPADSQISPSLTRIPNRTTYDSDAQMHDEIVPDIYDAVFDVDRPWPRAEVNFNKYYPIFAQNVALDSDTESYNVNKVVGADIGWSRPLFSLTPRDTEIVGTDLTILAGTNDAPQSYRSYIFRKDLPLQPEFDVEGIHGIALWADGNYKPGFFDGQQYPRIATGSWGSDATGSLGIGIEDETRFIFNEFYVTEDYKIDHRTTGRFLNILMADDYLNDPLEDGEIYKDKTYTRLSPWRISGIQLEVMKGGRR